MRYYKGSMGPTLDFINRNTKEAHKRLSKEFNVSILKQDEDGFYSFTIGKYFIAYDRWGFNVEAKKGLSFYLDNVTYPKVKQFLKNKVNCPKVIKVL